MTDWAPGLGEALIIGHPWPGPVDDDSTRAIVDPPAAADQQQVMALRCRGGPHPGAWMHHRRRAADPTPDRLSPPPGIAADGRGRICDNGRTFNLWSTA
jgi:hypothetical protein